MNVQFPDLLRPLLGRLLWRKNPSSKVIYLTFDDGPVPEVTPLVLDILDEYNLKATFFCVGDNVEKHPDIYNEILRRGHKTGNHTFNHLKGTSVSTDEYVANVQKASERIDSQLFRPPYGLIKYRQRKALREKYQLVMWDLITHDYNKNLSPETILKNIKRYSRNGSLVVFHDSIKAERNMLAVLPLAIEYWNSKGYRFGVL
ncbi:MAG: polysaccharide deacetylase family protein [Bacteroidota bacterium]|nr:polysaccharide deacetylase family protein [Bacteroidota bacterium]